MPLALNDYLLNSYSTKPLLMKKFTVLMLLCIVSLVMSCGSDGPLKECIICTQAGASSPDAEYCANKVTADAYKSTMVAGGATCHVK
jgi:hypothetical protein